MNFNKLLTAGAGVIITSMVTWIVVTLHNVELNIRDIHSEIRAVNSQNNIQNSLFQELYEMHGTDKRYFLDSIQHKYTPKMLMGPVDTSKNVEASRL